jgi:nicotinamidase-related amidase
MTTATKSKPLPYPAFFDPANAEKWEYAPDQAKMMVEAQAWAKKHGIKPASTDHKKVHLLLIDEQKDFCFPRGSLYVGGRNGKGAMEDNRRVTEFIYRNLNVISEITPTMDSHMPNQIFFSSFWLDKDGNSPAPFQNIVTDQIRSGDMRPNPAMAGIVCNGNYGWLMDFTKHYCSSLEASKKYKLYLWPFHCILGSDGHVLVGVIHEARLFHSFARMTASVPQVKGGSFLTENYSVLSPEVQVAHDGQPIGEKNVKFIKTLIDAAYVVIAGQASSHCVKSSIEDLLTTINAQDPKLCKKVYILKDCMSAVAVPDGKGGFYADYTKDAADSLAKFEAAGMHVVDSTVPIEDWEGVSL